MNDSKHVLTSEEVEALELARSRPFVGPFIDGIISLVVRLEQKEPDERLKDELLEIEIDETEGNRVE